MTNTLIIFLDWLIVLALFGMAWLSAKYGTQEPERVDGLMQINRKSFEFMRTQL